MSLRTLLLQFLLLASGTATSIAAPTNIVLITIDTARADRMGFLGSKAGLTPNLDRLARQSVVFSHAYAHVPLTTPSHATILTGTYPQFNHLDDLGAPFANDIPFLPDIFHQNGYRTAAFVGSQVLDPKGAAVPGFDRGFDTYDAGFHSRENGEDRYHSVERRAETVVDHAISWLEQHPKGPFFLWVHLYDPHDPYDPPAPFKARYAAAPYDGEIAYVDSAVGRLLKHLQSARIFDQALVAVVADHGEAFGEHNERSHGFFLYDETIHVPLLIKRSGDRAAGVKTASHVGLVDVAPTLLQEAGIAIPGAMQGVSLVKQMSPDAAQRRPSAHSTETDSSGPPIYSETDYPRRAFGWSSLRSLRAGRYLYIEAPERELYDQEADPQESHNLATSSKAVADTMAAQLEEFRRKTSATTTKKQSMSSEQIDQLQALGYVTSGSGNSGAKAEESGADPKQRIQTANLLHAALLSMEDDRYKEAIPDLEQVLKQEPEMPLANLELGRAWSNLESYDKALPWLRKAVQLTPESGRAHFELGMALAETGDWAGATPHLEAAAVRAPDSVELHFDLATAYEHMSRIPEATEAFKHVLSLNPDHYQANLMFGRLLGMHGNPKAAIPYLRKAVNLQPQSPDPHKFLANVYIEMGQDENSRRERAEAERLTASKP